MSSVKFDVSRLSTQIIQTADRVVRGVSQVMIEEGEKAAELAREFAPVDEGNLEAAIQVDIDRSGLHGRYVVTVYVDESMAAPSYNKDGSVTKGTENKTVGDYALKIHEGLAPFGSGGAGRLGLLSRQKDSGRGIVGGKYLVRALDAIQRELLSRAREIVRRKIR